MVDTVLKKKKKSQDALACFNHLVECVLCYLTFLSYLHPVMILPQEGEGAGSLV